MDVGKRDLIKNYSSFSSWGELSISKQAVEIS